MRSACYSQVTSFNSPEQLVSDASNAGNCLYYSLSDQLYGSFDHGDEIRQLLADHMTTHKRYFMQFVVAEGGERRRPKRAAVSAYATRSADVAAPSDEDKERRFEEMVATTRKNGEWGSSESLQAFCQVYHVDINVYTMDGVQAFRDVNALPDEHRDVINVAFHVRLSFYLIFLSSELTLCLGFQTLFFSAAYRQIPQGPL